MGTRRSPLPVAATVVVVASGADGATGAAAAGAGVTLPSRIALALRRPALKPYAGIDSMLSVGTVAEAGAETAGALAGEAPAAGASPTSIFNSVAPTSTVSSTLAIISVTFPDSAAF